MEDLRLDNQLCFKIYSLSKSITRLYAPLLDEINITYPQYLTMMVLWEDKDIYFKELSSKLRMKTGTLTPILNKLETLGYLERKKDIKDDRKVLISITDEGIKLGEKAKGIPRGISRNIKLTEEEYLRYREDFNELLKKVEDIEGYFK